MVSQQGQGHNSHIQEISTEGGSQKCTVRVSLRGWFHDVLEASDRSDAKNFRGYSLL